MGKNYTTFGKKLHHTRVKLIGAGFWDELDGTSEVEFFDDLYGKYLEKYAFINGVIASCIIGHVEWDKEPALARCIRDQPGVPGC
jgi:hypothetical protein